MSVSIQASLCDSRSCNQNGGGEHLIADVEDLLQLLPGRARATLTTCMGLCNVSPNILLQSTGGSALCAQQSRLVNDGGLRMRVEPCGEGREEVASDRVIINEATVRKVAAAVGFRHPPAIRAVECKSAGNKCVQAGNYKEALQHFILAYSLLAEEPIGDDPRTAAPLQLSILLCCVKSRLLWADDVDGDEKTQQLRLAAEEAFTGLTANAIPGDVAAEVDSTEHTPTVYALIAQLARTIAGGEMPKTAAVGAPCGTPPTALTAIAAASGGSGEEAYNRPTTAAGQPTTGGDQKLLVQLCVALAHAWGGLAAAARNGTDSPIPAGGSCEPTAFAEGALLAYTGALAVAAASAPTKGARVFKAQERRRVEKAAAALLVDPRFRQQLTVNW